MNFKKGNEFWKQRTKQRIMTDKLINQLTCIEQKTILYIERGLN